MFKAAVRYIIRSVVLVGLLTAMVGGGWLAFDRLFLKAAGPHAKAALVVVNAGDGHATIRWTLKRAGVISELYHYDAARILKGRDFVPKEGEFEIPAGASLERVLSIIHAGRSLQRRLTIIEGTTARDVIAKLANSPHFSGAITQQVPEGSILPETYFYTQGTDRDAMLRRMQEKRQMLLLDAWINRVEGLPFETPQDALILASIIELETNNSADRREVAGVFVNRLRKGMRLQSDPTVLYGQKGDPKRTIRRSDLKRKTAWNTYVIDGLPVTPICNPSQDSIDAALQPAKTKNYYFVSDAKGGLLFARTLDDHNKNVQIYRRALKRAGNS